MVDKVIVSPIDCMGFVKIDFLIDCQRKIAVAARTWAKDGVTIVAVVQNTVKVKALKKST